MTREQLEHVIRAAGAVLNTDRILLVGSQAILASTDEIVPEAHRSIEADIAAFDEDGMSADLIDGTIGELSMFHDTFGYYAQGVTQRTAVLPEGWRERLIRYATPGTGGITALCLEPHDLWLSKAVANRPKDREFCAALVARALVDVRTLKARCARMPQVDPAQRALVQSLIAAALPGNA